MTESKSISTFCLGLSQSQCETDPVARLFWLTQSIVSVKVWIQLLSAQPPPVFVYQWGNVEILCCQRLQPHSSKQKRQRWSVGGNYRRFTEVSSQGLTPNKTSVLSFYPGI